MSKKSELLKSISDQLSKLNINIQEVDLELLRDLRTNLLDISDEKHSSYTVYSIVDVLIITILAVW